jgi:hypothetical protein
MEQATGRMKEAVVAMYGEQMPMPPNLAGRYKRSIAWGGSWVGGGVDQSPWSLVIHA